MAQLWHLHSRTLGGFYQSDIYVAAATPEEADAKIVAAFRAWLLAELEESSFVLDLDSDDLDSHHALQAALGVKTEALRAELANKRRIDGPGLVQHAL